MNEFLLSLLPELVGALVSALIGFLLGMFLLKIARIEDEEERKEDMLKSLITEVTDNKRLIDRGPAKFSATHVNNIDSILSTDAFDSAVFSGSYQLLTIETQRRATWFFNDCKQMNRLLERQEFYEIARGDNKGVPTLVSDAIRSRVQESRYISHQIMKLYSGLKEATEDMLSSLEEELGTLPDTQEVDGQPTIRKATA